MSKERLDLITENDALYNAVAKELINSPRPEFGRNMILNDIKFLIEQAERVQELEERNKFLEKAHRINGNIAEDMKEERNRYREALKFYANPSNYVKRASIPEVNIDGGRKAFKELEND